MFSGRLLPLICSSCRPRAGAESRAVAAASRSTAGAVLSGFVGVSEKTYSAMELPNFYVMILDVLARVLERSRIVRRYEIMASHNLASRAQRKCSIVRHGAHLFPLPQQIERPFVRRVNLTTVIGTGGIQQNGKSCHNGRASVAKPCSRS